MSAKPGAPPAYSLNPTAAMTAGKPNTAGSNCSVSGSQTVVVHVVAEKGLLERWIEFVPVMPLPMAVLCTVFNCVVPGFGELQSTLCCVGVLTLLKKASLLTCMHMRALHRHSTQLLKIST